MTTRPVGSVKAAYEFPLTRLIYCAHCEQLAEAQQNTKLRTRLMGWNQKGKLRYRHAEGVQCGCTARTIYASIVEPQFFALVQLLTISEDAIPLMSEIALQTQFGENPVVDDEKELEQKKRQAIAKLNVKLQNLKILFKEGDIAAEEYRIGKEQIRREIAQWEARTTDRQKKAMEFQVCLNAFTRLTSQWETASNAEKQQLAHSLFEYILYDLNTKQIIGFRLQPWADSYLIVRTELLAKEREDEGVLSSYIPFFDHTPTENEQTALSLATDYLEYLELTRYPQRLILEQLLIDEQ